MYFIGCLIYLVRLPVSKRGKIKLASAGGVVSLVAGDSWDGKSADREAESSI